jgi:hypothetical protein
VTKPRLSGKYQEQAAEHLFIRILGSVIGKDVHARVSKDFEATGR